MQEIPNGQDGSACPFGEAIGTQDLLCGFSHSAMFKLETNARNLKLSIGFVYTMLSQRVW